MTRSTEIHIQASITDVVLDTMASVTTLLLQEQETLGLTAQAAASLAQQTGQYLERLLVEAARACTVTGNES